MDWKSIEIVSLEVRLSLIFAQAKPSLQALLGNFPKFDNFETENSVTIIERTEIEVII